MTRNKRRVNIVFTLFVTNVAIIVALSGTQDFTGLDLDCTNNCSWVTCHLDRQNCSEYNLTVHTVMSDAEQSCSLHQCDGDRCCCSVQMYSNPGNSHKVTVLRRNTTVGFKIFDDKENMKPDAPKIISVNDSYGNIEIRWQTSMTGNARESLTSKLTYYKKGDVEKKHISVPRTTTDELYYHKIPGRHLEADTTYVVSVQSITNWSRKSSDSSNEWEFKTQTSTDALSDSQLLATIISLSIAAVILSGAIYVCFVRLKIKCCDPLANYPKPKLNITPSNKQEILKPVPAILSSISVDSFISDDTKPWSKTSLTDLSCGSLEQSSGISKDSSSLNYVNTEPANIKASVQDALSKAFSQISTLPQLMITPLTEANQDTGLLPAPISPFGEPANGTSCGSLSFMNKMYLILLPQQSVVDSHTVQTQTEVLSAYRPSDDTQVENHHQPFSLGPSLGVTVFMPTDAAYLPCSQELGKLSEESGATNTVRSPNAESRVNAGCQNLIGSKTELDGTNGENIMCDKDLSFGQEPAKSQSLLLVLDDYQSFQNLVGRSDALFSEQKTAPPEECMNRCQEESSSKIRQNLVGQTVPGFNDHDPSSQTPLLSLSADQPTSVIVDSGYLSI